MFRRGLEFNQRCPVCNLLLQRDYGDTWVFMVLTDRIPVVVGIVLVFFGFQTTTWLTGTAFLLALVIPLLATMRERQSLALALDYLVRVYLRDPTDEIHGGRAR